MSGKGKTNYMSIPLQPDLALMLGETEAMLLLLLHTQLEWNANCQLRDGRKWYWHTTKEWAAYLKIKSERTVQTSMMNLRNAGLVEVANYNKYKYDRTWWYSINYQKLQNHIETYYREEGIPDTLKGFQARLYEITSQGSYEVTSYHHYEVTSQPIQSIKNLFKQDKDIKEAPANAVQEQTSDKPEKTTGEGIMAIPEKPRLKTTAEILSAMSEKKAQQLTSLPEKTTPKSFEQVWKVEVSEMDGVHLVKNFTMQQLGQTKHFIKAIGEKEALPVLRATLRHWIRFTKKVKAAAGLKVTPDLPELGFVVKYSEHAYALFKELEGEQVQPTAPVPPAVTKGKIVIRKNKPQALPDAVQAPTPPHHIPESVKSDSGAAQGLQTQADDLVTLDFLAQYE